MYQDQDPVAPARPVDPVAERLLRARTIVISGEITQVAADVVSQLVALAPSRIATSPSS
jgi:ATP-dependent protease ClpP protease subunit